MPDDQVVVTGGSKGIGAAIATELAARGHEVVSLSRSGTAPVGRAVACDLTDEAALVAAVAGVAEQGSIASLVNNAGINVAHKSSELGLADYEQVMRVNASSTMLASREIYPHLKARGGGTIVNIGSFFDKVGVRHQLAYSASKAAIAAMPRVLAVEWARDGICVVNVAPGYIRTELSEFWQNPKSLAWIEERVPLRRPGTSQEVARFVASLLGERNAFLTGETIYIDGAHGINH